MSIYLTFVCKAGIKQNMEQPAQHTDKWHRWRHERITASDVPAAMGISPYKTPLQLYEQKILPEPPMEQENFQMSLGSRSEPIARGIFEFKMGNKAFPPALVELEGKPIGCSLDGWNREDNEIVEFKYTGKQKPPPNHHIIQVQVQLMCTNAKLAYYQSYDFKNEKVTLYEPVIIYPNREMQTAILVACCNFWEMVTTKKPPSASEKDWKPLPISVNEQSKLLRWKELQLVIAKLSKESEEIECWAKSLVTDRRMLSNGVKFTRVDRVGSISYQDIPELVGVDLEKYRKPGTSHVQMKVSG